MKYLISPHELARLFPCLVHSLGISQSYTRDTMPVHRSKEYGKLPKYEIILFYARRKTDLPNATIVPITKSSQATMNKGRRKATKEPLDEHIECVM